MEIRLNLTALLTFHEYAYSIFATENVTEIEDLFGSESASFFYFIVLKFLQVCVFCFSRENRQTPCFLFKAATFSAGLFSP